MRLILIRHGRTAWNAPTGQGRRFRGIIDLPLAEDGVRQAQITAQHLTAWPLAAVYTSPLQRAVHTAQIIAQPHGMPPRTVPGLTSMNYGDWAGQLDTDVAGRWPDLYHQWRHNPFNVRVPGGESAADLRERAVAALRTILAEHADGDTVVIVSHQVVTKTLICILAGLPDTAYWHVRQDLCSLNAFDYNTSLDRFTVVGLNDTCHLRPTLPSIRAGGIRIVLIRHGQTAWNEGAGQERFRGRTDLPLDETGHAQARAVASRLANEPLAALYTSPLLRARQTTTPLAETVGLPSLAHEGLIDIDYGHFQGLTHTEAAAAHPQLHSLWQNRPDQVHFPGGESLHDVQARLMRLLDEMVVRHPGQMIALLGHQVVNKVAACTLLGLDLDQIWRIRQDPCGFDLFQQVDGTWRTLVLNDTCHLAVPQLPGAQDRGDPGPHPAPRRPQHNS